MTFEESIKQLNEIVNQMESGNLSIDESLANSKSLNCTVVYSKTFVDEGYHNLQETYLSKNYREPDQVRMVKEAINYFKE